MRKFASAHVALLALVILSSAGCFSLGRTTKPRVESYTIDYTAPAPVTAPLPVVVQVLPLRSAAVYDRPDVVYRDGALRLDNYNYRRWSTQPTRMIRDLVERDLIASSRYAAVVEGPSVLTADFVLEGFIEQIEERNEDGCAAVLRLRFLLARQSRRMSGNTVFQRVYEAAEPCIGGDGDDFAAAMSRGMASISERLRNDVAAAIAAELSESPR